MFAQWIKAPLRQGPHRLQHPPNQPGDGDSVADLEIIDTLTEFDYPARDLMPRRQWPGRVRKAAVDERPVGAAYPTRGNRDAYLVMSRRRGVHVDKLQSRTHRRYPNSLMRGHALSLSDQVQCAIGHFADAVL